MEAILLAVVASIFWGVGTAVQKHGMATSFPRISLAGFISRLPHVLGTLFTMKVWLLGLAAMIAGTGFYGMALGQGDLTQVQPVMNLTAVVATIIGVLFLGERLLAREWGGMATILAGVLIIGLASGEQSAHLPVFLELLLFSIVTSAVVLTILLMHSLGLSGELRLSLAAGLVYGLVHMLAKVATQRALVDVGEPFSLARPEIWWSLATDYPIYVIFVANLLGGVLYQTAFANGRASVVAPMVTIISNLLPIVAAITIFGENLHAAQAVGILLVMMGTGIVASHNADNNDPLGIGRKVRQSS